MGWLDAFTGDAGKEAAEKNRQLYSDFKKEGLGYLDSGLSNSLASLGAAKEAYTPVAKLGTDYNKAGTLALNALGVNGAEGNAAATAAFKSSPGYDFTVNQALEALDRRAASRGMLASGNTSLDTLSTVTGLANQDYSNWLSQLGNYAGLGSQNTQLAASGLAGINTGQAGLYQSDASNRVNLASGVTTGLASANNAEATAAMQGSSNLWNFGQNLLALGTGYAGKLNPMGAK